MILETVRINSLVTFWFVVIQKFYYHGNVTRRLLLSIILTVVTISLLTYKYRYTAILEQLQVQFENAYMDIWYTLYFLRLAGMYQ